MALLVAIAGLAVASVRLSSSTTASVAGPALSVQSIRQQEHVQEQG
jgi:hypothetical protein